MTKPWLLLLFTLWLPFPLGAANDIDFQEGLHYHVIRGAAAPASEGEIRVMEFFWYGCPHCYEFEPYLERWLETKPADVDFDRVPATFNAKAALHARAFYALKAMDIADQFSNALFKAVIHDKRRLDSEQALTDFVAELGGDADAFRKALNSFAVDMQVRRAEALARRYGVTGVPSMVIDGRYRSGSGFASYAGLTEVTDYLVDRIREQRLAMDER